VACGERRLGAGARAGGVLALLLGLLVIFERRFVPFF